MKIKLPTRKKQRNYTAVSLTQEDQEVWQQATRNIFPLESDVLSTQKKVSDRVVTHPSFGNTDEDTALKTDLKNPKARPQYLPSSQIEHKTYQKIAKEQYRIERKLDLHGLTLHEAHLALSHFVLQNYQSQTRRLLVITGKGSVSQGGGAIKKSFEMWLTEPPLSQYITSFQTAHVRHGGSGAYYVLLRKVHKK